MQNTLRWKVAAWGIVLACAFTCASVSWGVLPSTDNEQKVTNQEAHLLFLRRNFFFGHRELSDILEGLRILSNAVDAFQNAPALRLNPNHVVRKRLLDSLVSLPQLASRRIGMSEAYTLPAMYFLFEEDSPGEAYSIVRLGLNDLRANNQVPLLAGFVAHVFSRDLTAAASHYETLAKRPGIPTWVGDLANRLRAGDDPFVTDERVRGTLCKVVVRSFPRALSFLEKNRPECRDAVAEALAERQEP